MRTSRIAYFFILILASCSNKGEGNRMINSKYTYDTIQKKHIDKVEFYTEKKNSLVLEKRGLKKDSLYKLKIITMPWGNKDSIPESNEFILFEKGRLKYIIENKVYLDRKYSLTKNSTYDALGGYLLGVNSERYHSIDFYKDSIIVYQNAEDESSFVFLKHY